MIIPWYAIEFMYQSRRSVMVGCTFDFVQFSFQINFQTRIVIHFACIYRDIGPPRSHAAKKKTHTPNRINNEFSFSVKIYRESPLLKYNGALACAIALRAFPISCIVIFQRAQSSRYVYV